MESLYTTPLNQSRREFRLLHLLPRSAGSQSAGTVRGLFTSFLGQWTTPPISCLLEKVSLDDCNTYTALSYTWGDASRTRQIQVNGKLVDITENLEVALRHLQQERGTLKLWADAICINQRDTDEKNSQVRQMTDIYRQARNVIIWLGPAAEESDRAIHYLDLIGRAWEKHELAGVGSTELIAIMREPENERNTFLKSRLKDVFKHLDSLFPNEFPISEYHAFARRGWWYRAWVIQELCVAQDPVFQCGKRRILFNHLDNADDFLLAYGWFRLQRTHYAEHPSDEWRRLESAATASLLSTNASKVMIAFRKKYQKQKDYTLYSLLRTTCANPDVTRIIATDNRDLIFSLLGLASDKNELEISVDYAIPARDIFIQTSKALLTSGHLELLSLRQINRRHSDLPSWAFDWSAEIHWPFGDSTFVDKPFAASRGSVPQVVIYIDDEQHVAAIKGLLIDKIEIVGSRLPDRAIDPNNPKAPDWNAADRFVLETERVCIGCSDEEIATILLGGLEYYNGEDNSTLLQHRRVTAQTHEGYKVMKEWLKLFREIEDINQNPLEFLPDGSAASQVEFEERSTRMDKTNRELQEFMPLLPACAAFWTSMIDSLDRTPFRSTKGYVGLGPKELEPGDVICLFFGSFLPHVIRTTQRSRYKLIGEAYIQGIMDGELMESTHLSTDFELC